MLSKGSKSEQTIKNNMLILNRFYGYFQTSNKRLYLAVASIMLVVLAVYHPTAQFGFSGLDDIALIEQDQAFLSDIGKMPAILKRPLFVNIEANAAPYFRPLVTLSLMLESQIKPLNAKYFHRTNIAIHLVNCFLLFFILIHFGLQLRVALGSALLFTVHPMAAHAVTWIPGRGDLLLVSFCLGMFLSIDLWQKRAKVFYLFTYAFCVMLALASKESAFIALPLSLVWVWWHKRSLKALLPVFGIWLSMGSLFLFFWFNANPARISHAGEVSLVYWLSHFPALLSNLGKIVLPLAPAVVEDYESLNNSLIFIGTMTCIVWILASFRSKNYASLWMVLVLMAFQVPTLIIVRSNLLETRLYFPTLLFSISFLIMSHHYLKNREYFWPLIHCLGLICALHTSRYLPDFKDRASFVKAAYLASPDNVSSTTNYALYLMDENDLQKSEAILVEALKKWPQSVLVHNNIAVLYLRTQRYAEARTHLEQAIALDPSYSICYKNIIIVLAFQRQWQDMDPYLLKLKSLRPGTFQDLLGISSQMKLDGMHDMALMLAQKVNTMLLDPGIAH